MRKKPPKTARRGDGSPLGRTPGLDDDPGLALRCSVSVYRDPQRPEAPPEEIERFVLARYSTRWQWVTVATGILLMLPLARALVLGMSEGYAGFGAIAAAGAILIVMVQVMMRPKVTLEANYTRGELVVQGESLSAGDAIALTSDAGKPLEINLEGKNDAEVLLFDMA